MFYPNPLFVNSVEVEGVSASGGELTVAYEPDMAQSGAFAEAAVYRTGQERATSSLLLRAESGRQSAIEAIHDRHCTFDAHLNSGLCSQFASIDQFEKKEIWEDVATLAQTSSKSITYESADAEVVTDTFTLSIGRRYTVLNPVYSPSLGLLACGDFGNNVLSMVVPKAACCKRLPGAVVFVGNAAGSIAYTTNFGKAWDQFYIGSSVPLVAAAVVYNNALFIDDAGHAYRIGLRSQNFSDRSRFSTPLLDGLVSDGRAGIGIAKATAKLYLLLGDYAFASTPVYSGATPLTTLCDARLECGFAILDTLNRVVWSLDGKRWQVSAAFSNLLSAPAAIAVYAPGEWIVSASDALYRTWDYGRTWLRGHGLPFPGPFHVATRHVMESAGWDAGDATLRLYRTTNANSTFVSEPNGPDSTLLNQGLLPSRLLTAPEDPNIIWVAGYNPTGSPVILGRPN